MKRKLFFVAMAFALAIVGVAATKANHKLAPVYYQENAATCSVFTGTVCTAGSHTPCRELVGSTNYTIYNAKTTNPDQTSTCSSPLTYQ